MVHVLCKSVVVIKENNEKHFNFRTRVPQIIKIYEQKSTVGISINSLTVEVVSYALSTLYNLTNSYRLINYFEYIVLLIQDYILMAFVLFYRRKINSKTISAAITYSFVVLMFATNIFPKSILSYLIPATIPMGTTSKILQLVEIFKVKNTNDISSLSCFISAFTNASKKRRSLKYIQKLKYSFKLEFTQYSWILQMPCC